MSFSAHFTRFSSTKYLFLTQFIRYQINQLRRQKGQILSRAAVKGFKAPVFILPAAIVVSRGWLFGVKKSAQENMAENKDDIAQLLKSIDEIYGNNDNEKVIEELKPRSGDKSDEILWRLARSTYNLGQVQESAKQKEMYTEAFNYAKEALEINDQNFACHKWYAILLDIVGGYEGTKKRIENAYIVKEHFLKAAELNPKDATSQHTLGFWHFLFADLPWLQRKIASAIFSSPPTATYEEALGYFLKAEELEAGFYTMNLLMIGKTYARQGNKPEARKYLEKVQETTPKTADDHKAHEEAKQLMKSVK